MDMREMVEKVKKKEPLYGTSTLTPYMQGVASRNSRYSGIWLHVVPWFNFVNHDQVLSIHPYGAIFIADWVSSSMEWTQRSITDKQNESLPRRMRKRHNPRTHRCDIRRLAVMYAKFCQSFETPYIGSSHALQSVSKRPKS